MSKKQALKAAGRTIDAAALLSVVRRIGLRRSARIVALATSAYLDRQAPTGRKRRRAR
jgi:hypothetical protein